MPKEQRGGGARLERLTNLKDMEVAGDSIDVRGWDLTSARDEKLGTVRDLVVDLDVMKAKYLLVDLESTADAPAAELQDRHALVPVDRTRLDITERSVRVPAADVEALRVMTGVPDRADETDETGRAVLDEKVAIIERAPDRDRSH